MSDSSKKKKSADITPLSQHVENCVRDYLTTLNGTKPPPLYSNLLEQLERPMLQEVMRHFDGNNTRASEILGINRATLRKKLQKYNLGE